MQESLFSPLWYRVSQRRPRFRREVKVRQMRYRGRNWHLLINEATGQQHRASQQAYEFIGRCDGLHTVQEIWDDLLERLGDNAPTQDEVVQLLIHLDEQGIFAYESAPNPETLVRRREERLKQKRKPRVNPFALRVPLGNPTKLLSRIQWLAGPMVNWYVVVIWTTAVALALLAAVSNWPALKAHGVNNLTTPHYLFLIWLSFPFIKALHEMAHALTVVRWGGEVREFGFTLFLLMPAPYVDASDAGGFRHRSQRVFVSAAGIMAELALASLALLIWLNVQPGTMRDVAFVTMFIASVSTLLFNGNPLLPFDAYYMLSDLIDVPNLSSRSKKYWNNILRRMVLGVHGAIPEYVARGETKWLFGYFPLSMIYRIFIFGAIIVWIGSKSLALGIVAAIVAVSTFIVIPLWKTIRDIIAFASSQGIGRRSWLALSGISAAVFFLICVIPVPHTTLAHGVVWLPEKARVRAKSGGFITEVLVRNGDHVEPGRILVLLEDPALVADKDALASQLARARTQRYTAISVDAEGARKAEEEIERLRADLRRAEQKIAELEVRSGVSGSLVMPHQQDLVGTFVRQGGELGYVFEAEQVGIRAVVPEYDAALVRQDTKRIAVRVTDHPSETLLANLVRDVPAATLQLPSAALGDRGGGPHVTDPSDTEGVLAVEPVVLLDLTLPDTVLERAGGRALVRFEHSAKPLASQWYRRIRQVFLKQFNPVS
ncbi:MAG: efflux RND transporter periplasmic adaptor subunit [Betaproteobacteria bacterium]|nr:MAG: efflux RND transporter periplasmic adaptor subunit [Betaproteobacteria bacterium]